MDQTDLKILDTLQRAPGISTADLADRVGLSSVPCWRRIKRLEELGAIQERAVILDPKVMGLSVSVIAEVRLRQHGEDVLESFEKSVRERPEIVECFSMAGQQDYILRVVVRDVEEYEALLKKTLLHLPAVASINSSFALKTIKLTTQLPICSQ